MRKRQEGISKVMKLFVIISAPLCTSMEIDAKERKSGSKFLPSRDGLTRGMRRILDEEIVQCPGQAEADYCDCEGDCTGNSDLCSCEEAQTCCSGLVANDDNDSDDSDNEGGDENENNTNESSESMDVDNNADCNTSTSCNDGFFCNYDSGTSGFCEACEPSSCESLGLATQEGVNDCNSQCIREDAPSPSSGNPWPSIDVESPFEVFMVDDEDGGCEVSSQRAERLKEAGFTKVACPFDVLIAGTDNYKDEYLLLGANVLANILDQDSDGIVDDPAVVERLSYKKSNNGGAVLSCGISEEEEVREEMLEDVFDYSFSCQTWKANFWDGNNVAIREIKGILMEEAFHLVHNNGYAVVYPEMLGLDDFTSSIIGRETARLQCVKPGWFHPENQCPPDSPRQPGNPASLPLSGTCASPVCDISEFYKMALFLAIGMGKKNDPNGPLVWMSDYMPGRQSDIMAMLSDEFKEMIANPTLHQLRAPITGEYNVVPALSTSSPTSTNPDMTFWK